MLEKFSLPLVGDSAGTSEQVFQLSALMLTLSTSASVPGLCHVATTACLGRFIATHSELLLRATSPAARFTYEAHSY